MNLTVCYVTARRNPQFKWMFDSLRNDGFDGPIIVIDVFASERTDKDLYQGVKWIEPKPTVWQGKSKVTRDHWWAVANARNTALCVANAEWLLFVDDRSVLLPGWYVCVQAAIQAKYAMAGAYQKRINMKVENGVITELGELTGKDSRFEYIEKHIGNQIPFECPGEWWFGCFNLVPMEWAIAVNGWDETCDSLGMEDIVFGSMLKNSGYTMKYDKRVMLVEDRTPEEIWYPVKRIDKGKSPLDKSHALWNKLRGLNRATHPHEICTIRERYQNGGGWPVAYWPTHDWYDNQPIAEFV